jgi:hypothetical protein
MKVALKLSVALAGALVGACLIAAPASARSASTATTDPELTAAGAQAVGEAGHIVDFYTALGVGSSDIPTASAAQASTLSGVADLVATSASTPTLPTLSAPPTDCSNTGALVSYSQQVAQANDAIDPNATTLGQETVYMYLSHFFDLPTVCGDNTAVYPDWIVNDDRSVYNSYLTASNNIQLATTIPQMILNANTLVADPASTIAKVVAGGPGARLAAGLNIADRATAGHSLIDEMQTVMTLLNANNSPETIVSQMRADLSSTWTDADTQDAIISTAAALMSPSIGEALLGLGTVVISFELTGVNTIMQAAAFNSMRLSTSGRAGERMLRSFGF